MKEERGAYNVYNAVLAPPFRNIVIYNYKL